MNAEPTCDLCGTPAELSGEPGDTPAVPMTWTTSVENGSRKVFCASCSREHLRSIEGKLDSAWW
jgi:hypothetical protein